MAHLAHFSVLGVPVLYWLRASLVGFCFAAFYLSATVVGWLLLAPVAWLSADDTSRMLRCQRIVSGCFGIFLAVFRVLRLVDTRVPVDLGIPEGVTPIILCNHPSTLDVIAIGASYPGASIVVKRVNFAHPLLRPIFRWCGHIDAGDGSIESSRALMDGVADRLGRGFPVIIFPEGTRSPPGGLGHFHKGAFAAAVISKAPVLPVVLAVDPPVIHKEAPWHAFPSHAVSYSVLPQALISDPGPSSRKLQRQVVAVFEQVIGVTARRSPAENVGGTLVRRAAP